MRQFDRTPFFFFLTLFLKRGPKKEKKKERETNTAFSHVRAVVGHQFVDHNPSSPEC
jgi:hypothetical protein